MVQDLNKSKANDSEILGYLGQSHQFHLQVKLMCFGRDQHLKFLWCLDPRGAKLTISTNRRARKAATDQSQAWKRSILSPQLDP